MVAYAFELGVFPVEEESFFRDIFQRTDAESGGIFVDRFAVYAKGCAGDIQRRILGRPSLRFGYKEILGERLPVGIICGIIGCHDGAVRGYDIGFNPYGFTFGRTFDFGYELD